MNRKLHYMNSPVYKDFWYQAGYTFVIAIEYQRYVSNPILIQHERDWMQIRETLFYDLCRIPYNEQ